MNYKCIQSLHSLDQNRHCLTYKQTIWQLAGISDVLKHIIFTCMCIRILNHLCIIGYMHTCKVWYIDKCNDKCDILTNIMHLSESFQAICQYVSFSFYSSIAISLQLHNHVNYASVAFIFSGSSCPLSKCLPREDTKFSYLKQNIQLWFSVINLL